MLVRPVKKKVTSFFTTSFGRKLVFYGAGCTTLTLFVGNFLPQTLFLKNYQEIVTSYKNGIEQKVPEKLIKRLDKAFDLLDVASFERKIIKPFTVFGFDLFQAGSTKYRFGCTLGIPVNYTYETTNDIDRNDVRFRNEPIKWDSKSGKLLQNSLVLTEDEQLFGLCKSILQLQTHHVLLNSLFPSLSFLTVYTIGNGLNQRLNLYARPFGLRLIMYSILGLFGIGTWSFLKDFNQVKYDADIDEKLCELGTEFIDAGIRYYDKLLTKNIALRDLLGDDTYTAKGNENYFLRQKSLPITFRKSYFETRMHEVKQKLEEPETSNNQASS